MKAIMKSVVCASLLLSSSMVWSAGDLAQRPERLQPIELGKLTETELLDYYMQPKEYTFVTGQSYRLKIQASGLKEYAFRAPDFFESIYIRKIEAGGVEIKGVGLSELEFEDVGEAEIFFVPVRAGEFPFYVKGHEERGMAGVFKVE
ncbi:hypothetical protein LH51_13450 [Nitrincola sp. A-D6]|uniref:hypothetical protein n=1 Tax=Nitrincola sp. A-D6 TaxID=1545442 RepID=UPI00051FEEF5|nr:hypothetical protein [Nitrincola sp. A-D6]KGK41619.1 hypothetical protein LH51_13450 [Nitrincola sp. A-D6]